MDYIALIIGFFIISSGILLGYLFSPRKQKTSDKSVSVEGALQKYAKNDSMDVSLAKIDKITHDTYIFTYDLPDQDLPLGLHVGQHIAIIAGLATKEFPEGEEIRRKYTPISRVDQKGTFELLIKVYRRGIHPKFPEGGILTQHLESLKIGDKIKIVGPLGKLSYHGNGTTKIQRKEKVQTIQTKEFGLICGGTGIAPMYQILKAVLDNPQDKTIIHLLFANKTEEDILLRPELTDVASDPRINIHYVLDAGAEGWKGFIGYVTKYMIEKTMPKPGKNTVICTCGPGPMNKMLATQLAELGYPEDHVFKF